MEIVKFLSIEAVEREEIRTIKALIEAAKPVMAKSSSNRAYLSIEELDKHFPSKRSEDRYPESIINNVRKYVNFYNYKFCKNGIYYHLGSMSRPRDGKKVAFLQEIKRQSGPFNILDEAILDMDDKDDKGEMMQLPKSVAGVPIEKLKDLPEDVKERLSQTEEANTT